MAFYIRFLRKSQINLTNNSINIKVHKNNFPEIPTHHSTSHIARRSREKLLTEKRVHPRRRRRRGGDGILEKEDLSPSLLAGDTLVLRGSGLLDGDDEVVSTVRYHRLFESRVTSFRKTRDTERTADQRKKKKRNDTVGLAFVDVFRHRDHGYVSVRVMSTGEDISSRTRAIDNALVDVSSV